jgi:hypothetical protein
MTLDKPVGQVIINMTVKFMKKKSDLIREYLSQLGKKGGRARADKYDKATLSKWAKKGGRPRKEKKQ